MDSQHDRVDPPQGDLLEPIAVIGFSFKFPQGATSSAALWKMFEEKRCAMTEWPSDRINLDAFYHVDQNRCDTLSVRGGNFLEEDLALFDASFFSITAREAMSMDPQQRMLLETAYRALENAGISMEKASGSRVGVYTGSMAHDFPALLLKDPECLPRHALTGITASLLANRLSWFFNFLGPSVNLDSGCSSSLVALHIACQGLRNGDSSMAIVAGANAILAPEIQISLNNMGFLSTDSRCYSFDDRANGYARGEGCAVLVIKRVSDAIQDGDTIRAIIRSTGSNQDGHTPGITQPNEGSQISLIQETYDKAGLDFATTRFFEAHGTGTSIGDPIEADAVGNVFRNFRSADEPLFVGSVKSNIGHLEGASGVASVIKTILALEKGIIPPNANFERSNPKINMEHLKIKIPVEMTPWPTDGLRRASVNSFGIGGTNSHAVLEDTYNFLRLRHLTGNHCTAANPPVPPATLSLPPNRTNLPSKSNQSLPSDFSVNKEKPPQLMKTAPGSKVPGNEFSKEQGRSIPAKILVWSAADKSALEQLVAEYHMYFMQVSSGIFREDSYLEELSYTLDLRRNHFPWRSYAVIESTSALEDLQKIISPPVCSSKKLGLGFVFSGQGSQYQGMGKELLSYPIFEKTLQSIESIFQDLGCQWSLVDKLLQPEHSSSINLPEYSQPMTTALQIGLVNLLRSFNVLPSMVVGHSSGEIAAAYAVGGLSLESACKVSFFRGKFAGELAKTSQTPGAMMSVNLSATEINSYLDKWISKESHGCISVACINSPQNVTIAGDEDLIDLVYVILERDQIFARKLKTAVAYHSTRMHEIASQYALSLQALERGDPINEGVVMVSSVTGERCLTTEKLSTAEYWAGNMIEPVNFLQAVSQLTSETKAFSARKLGVATPSVIYDLIEIGPHSTLKRAINETLATNSPKSNVRYHSILSKYSPSDVSTLALAGHLYSSGYPIALHEVNQALIHPPTGGFALFDLPEYSFNHSAKYWHESRLNKHYRLRKHPRLELLGTPAGDSNPLEMRWRKFFDPVESPWIEDLKVTGTPIYPAAGMIVMAIEGAKQMADRDQKINGYRLKDLTFSHSITVNTTNSNTEAQLYMRPIRSITDKESTSSEFRICLLEHEKWVETCKGSIRIEYKFALNDVDGKQEKEAKSRLFKKRYDDALRVCDKPIKSENMYQIFGMIGLNYGPAFKRLKELAWDGADTAVGEISTYDLVKEENEPPLQPHVLHPATLDTVLQLPWAALTKGGTNVVPTPLPTSIEDMWIAGSGLGFPEPTTLHVCSRSRFKGLRSSECSAFALDSMGELKILISSMKTTAISSDNARTVQPSSPKKICFNMDWKPDPTLMTSQQILALCGGNDRTNSAEPIQFYQELELLMFSYISKILKEIESAPPSHRKIPSHITKYIEWLRLHYHSGKVPDRSLSWVSMSQDAESMEALANRLEATNAQGKLFVTAGRHLLPIIQGSLDPLELLFSSSLAENHYQEVSASIWSRWKLFDYIDVLAHKNPELRILEIGAGVGSMTGYVLAPMLLHGDMESGTPRFSKYDYTDISDYFFAKAKERFSSAPNMEFKSLNIETDPVSQGFTAGSYDLIVASNVFHVTQDLGITLRNTRKLLKTGGKLLLLEITEPEILRCNFFYGTLPGWWNGTEEYRKWSPCVTEAKWNDLLLQNGFSGIDFVLPDYQDKSCHEMSVMVSTAQVDIVAPLSECNIVIITDSDSQLQFDISCLIRSQLESLGHPECAILTTQEMRTSRFPASASFIFLPELERPFLHDLDNSSFDLLQELLFAAKYMLWVNCADPTSPSSPKLDLVTGLARALRSERADRSFITLALEKQNNNLNDSARIIMQVLRATRLEPRDNKDLEYRERDGMIWTNRVVEANYLDTQMQKITAPQFSVQEFQKGPPLVLTIATPGLMDSIQFREDTACLVDLKPDEIEIEIKALGVNFRDVLIILGKDYDDEGIGCECAGIVTRVGSRCIEFQSGDRVCATLMGCASTYARCNYQLAVKVPDSLTYPEAAAFPVAGATAHYALIEVARLQKGESVLIHSGAGGTGQMAIQIAQLIGAEVFVTVGSQEKKELLLDIYQIPEDHIFYSRDTGFNSSILRITESRGVDVILNSLAGESLIASWESIAPFGRFVEIGKADINANSKLPMVHFAKSTSFSAVAINDLSKHRPSILQRSLSAVKDMIGSGKLKLAYPLQVFPISKAEDAFRFLQSGKHTGKIVLSIDPTDLVPTSLPAKSSYKLDPSATFVIAGGLGGLGRCAARWMAKKGARNLILLSRSGPQSETACRLLMELRDCGVNVATPKCDVSCPQSVSNALAQCEMPVIKGCLQCTMVLKDALFENMTFSEWTTTVKSKVQSSWNLHAQLPTDMDFFIMLSSLSGIIGSIGQSNYAAGNTYQDALAQYRNLLGQKAIALDLGLMSEVGIMAENEGMLRRHGGVAANLAKLSETDFHALLELYCNPGLQLFSPLKAQPMVGVLTPAHFRSKGLELPAWSKAPMFSPLMNIELHGASSLASLAEKISDQTDYAAKFILAQSLEQAHEVVSAGIVQKLAKTLSIEPNIIDINCPLHTYGVDSLLAVELRNWINKVFVTDIAVFEITGQESSVGTIVPIVMTKSPLRTREGGS